MAVQEHGPALSALASPYGVSVPAPLLRAGAARLLLKACRNPEIRASRVLAEVNLDAANGFGDAFLAIDSVLSAQD